MSSTTPDATLGRSGVRAAVARPRVLLVGPFPPTKGGITTFMLNLMASPLAEEFDFVPFTTSRPQKTNVTENWGYMALFKGGIGRMIAGIAVTAWHVLTFPVVLVLQRISIVQVQSSDYLVYWEGALYVWIAKLMGRKVLFRLGGSFDIFHGTARPAEKRWISAALRLPDYIIAQSRFARDYIRGAGREGPMVLLPNWTRDANIADVPREPVEAPVCLFIANLEAVRKGVEEVFAAMTMLHERGSPARFLFLAMPPVLIERLQAMQMPSVVGIESFVPHSRALQAMRECQIFLLPSHGEGFPNSLVEAMGAGMACIATPVGAVPEMTTDGEAIVIPVGDAKALADSIERIVSDPALFRSLAAKAQAKVRSTYVAGAALPELAAAYRASVGR